MPHDFSTFKTAVARQFERMQHGPNAQLFRVDIAPDDLWAAYLAAFPPGTNLVYRERTEYDCSCCRQFVRTIGNVVGVVDGALVSLWDAWIPEEPAYQAVADALAAKVLAASITGPFLHYEPSVGTDKNFEELTGLDGGITGTKTWSHFHVNLDKQRFVRAKDTIPTAIGERRSAHDVFLRSLTEIDDDAIETVLDLIGQGSLYRGEEHRATVQAFRVAKRQFTILAADPRAQDLYAWTADASGAVARIRNTVIGTLLVDLSEGKDLDASVRAFEAKVAPTNYKRPSALVTKAMIEKAKERIEELGLTSALDRRYARITDISIKDLLFADRSTRKAITGGGVFDDLLEAAPTPIKNLDKIETVPIDRFIAEIIPRAASLEILFENRLVPNLVTLIAPVDPTARQLFKWRNGFSWSYKGEIADSDMRQAVVARGGSVSGVFRFTHSWNYRERNASLMDLHVFMPGSRAKAENGIHDTYGNAERVGWNNRRHLQSGGVQDVDYVNAAPEGYVPVENITFPDLRRMPDGVYICKIHNWHLRPPTQGGFKAEIEFGGTVYEYEYTKPLRNKEWVTVAEVTLRNGVFDIKHHLPVGSAPREAWGLSTQTFRRVNAVMLSPNHWDGEGPGGNGVGNRHYLFMLEGAKNEDGARGFYNEFLAEELTPHRKVFEVVAGKMKPTENPSGEQLSGLGFSSTARNTLVCRVKGSFTRTVRVVF